MSDPDPHDEDIFAPVKDRAYRFIQLDLVQGIARITLNRPPANVLSIDAMEDVNAALESLEYQREVKLVVLAATGKYFSAGFEVTDHLGDRAYLFLELAAATYLYEMQDTATGQSHFGPAFSGRLTLGVGWRW